MFYSNQPVEKPLPKPLPNAPLEKEGSNKAMNSLLSLPMQRFYSAVEDDSESRRIPICMTEDEDEQDNYSMHIRPPSAGIRAILKSSILQNTVHKQNPLRLDLVYSPALSENFEEPEQIDCPHGSNLPFYDTEDLPYQFKAKWRELEYQLLSNLYVKIGPSPWSTTPSLPNMYDTDYLNLAFELPYATSTLLPPTPPPKEATTTPAFPPPIILPLEAYSIQEKDDSFTQSMLYLREEEASTYYDQSLLTSSPRVSASVFCFEEQQVTDDAWDAIFHPLSTFKHNKGELEYHAWNSANLPIAAARVAQRVMHPTSHTRHDSTAMVGSTDITEEATIPHIMPTPPLKPSPVLTLTSEDNDAQTDADTPSLYALEESSATLVVAVEEEEDSSKQVEDGYYYNMLQKIRGDNASLEDEEQIDGLSTSQASSQLDKETISNNSGDVKMPQKKSKTGWAGFLNSRAVHADEEKQVAADSGEANPEIVLLDNPRFWTEKRLFWFGFMCPLLWYYGSIHISAANRMLHPTELRWQKRCRMAALYFSIVLSVVGLVISVKAAGSAGVRQTQTDTIRAVIAD